MSEHTPSPWSVFNGNNGETLAICIGDDSNGKTPCIVNWMGFDSNQIPRKQNIANTHLIAAAPELLEALEGLLENYKYNQGKGLGIGPIMKAKTAIKKAKGETP